jgi:hypothetical protein
MHSKTKLDFFLEVGGFVDVVISSPSNGWSHTFYPDTNNHIIDVYQHGELSDINQPGGPGIFVGAGISITLRNVYVVIRPDYKLKLNTQFQYEETGFNQYWRLNVVLRLKGH